MMNEPLLSTRSETEYMMFRRVDASWTADFLLEQKGWFPLPDVMKCLDPKGSQYRKILAYRERLLRQNRDCLVEMGLKQYGSRLWAEMSMFRHWYAANEALHAHRVPKSWDLQTFMSQQEGIYFLKGALQLLPEDWPIKYPAMKKLIHDASNPRSEIGADKLDGSNYVVFLPKFAEWIRNQMP